MLEKIWKSYIDFEIEQGELVRVRALYQQLIDRTQHVKVWISWMKFEFLENGDPKRARLICDQAQEHFKT